MNSTPKPTAKSDNVPRPGKVSHGHLPHMTGSGFHDTRPRATRTRGAAKRTAINDQQ